MGENPADYKINLPKAKRNKINLQKTFSLISLKPAKN